MPPEALRAAFNAAFADYLVALPSVEAPDWPGLLSRQGIDLDASRVALDARGVLGFALVGRHAARSRLATMGLRPEARGFGLAQRLLDAVIAEARARGDDSMELEVFAQNARALALYRARGFATVAPLHGYERAPAPSVPAPPGEAVDAPAARAWLDALPEGLLPYQVSGRGLRGIEGLRAWRAGAAQLAFRVGREAVHVVSLVDRHASQDGARALARALAAAYPRCPLRVPQLQRPDLGGDALEAEGWARASLHQFLMRLPLR